VQAFNALAVRLVQARCEAEALAARVARADRLAALGRLSSGLAHEIRNPLAAMRLKIENAQAAARSSEPLDFLLSQTARLEGLVRNLLAMTQPLDLHAERVVLSAWLAEHAQAVAPEAERRGIALQIAGDPQGASFDAFHLGRALDNLLLNALQHAPRGGIVRATAVRDGDWLRVRVEDDGPGVPAALRASLFEPFVTGRAEGTGLGLAIVREIVVAHGGGVRETAPARGACFEMELPWPAS
jgi:signal transduction histidine kinase